MIIAGVDEVGRGPLAGPVVTAAVVLPEEFDLPGLTDSKKLTKRKREVLSAAIKEQALAWSMGDASVAEIDELNILHATMLAMQRAVAGLDLAIDRVLVDGNRAPEFGIPAESIIGGDGLKPCISAASIIAKVARDQLMQAYAESFPEYGFERNSGYPTKQHRDALIIHGATPIHRRSFAPVRKVLGL
jgi:ribonuclease HII